MFKNNLIGFIGSGAFVLFLLIGCKEKGADNVDWPKYLGNYEMSHYSKVSQINKENVNQLEISWQYHTLDTGDFQCNPIIVKGILYGISGAGSVFALNAKTGQENWKFIPSETKRFLKVRGVSYWENENESRILCTYDEWLYALDAKTGKPIPSFGDSGRVTLRSGLGPTAEGKYLMSRTPGTVFEDLIVMPTVMMEEPGSAPGFIQAFNVISGKLEWVFHTIPLPGEFGFDTWPKDVHVKGIVGGANNWTGMSLDKKRGIIFAPTGSAGPDFFGGSRVGKNLFANTLLALDVRTGKRIWHYKIVNHDIWDMDLPAPTNLATIVKDGKRIDVVVQLTKTGHVFVLDRESGKPIYPVEEMSFPSSPVKEESAWPTQVLPKIPLPFTSQKLEESNINKLSPDYDSLLMVFRNSNKGRYQPFSDVPTLINPGLMGGAEWGGAAIDPEGILYVPANEVPWVVTLKRNTQKSGLTAGELAYVNNCSACHGVERKGNPGSGFPSLVNIKNKLGKKNIEEIITKGKGMMPGFPQISRAEKEALLHFIMDIKTKDDKQKYKPDLHKYVDPWSLKGYSKFIDSENNPGVEPPWGTLTAIDLNTGLHKWKIPLGENKSYKDKYGIETGTENYGGPIVTSGGLLFIAATADNKIRAFDKNTGTKVWEWDLPVSGFATPSTYMVDGVQYVVIACGGTRLDRPKGDLLIAFKLSSK